MLRKLGIAGAVAGAALALSVAPAHAGGGDPQFNQNLQLIPWQACSANVAGGVLTFAVPLGSPQSTEDCVNGPVSTHASSDKGDGSDDYGYDY